MTAGGLVGAGAALLVAGMALGNLALLMAGAGPLVMAALGVALARPRLELRRTVDRSRMTAGEALTVTLEASVGRGPALLLLTDDLPPEFVLTSGSNIHLLWKGLRPTSTRFEYRVKPGKRGDYTLPPTRWHLRHPLGLVPSREGTAGVAHEVRVAPRLPQLHRLRPPRARAATLHPDVDSARIGQPTTDFREIREYAPGDPVRLINWKASARSSAVGGPPLVNQYELEGRKSVWLFVDATQAMEVGTNLDNGLERAVEAASGLASYFLRRGYRVGASFYGAREQPLRMDGGQRQWLQIARRLIALRPQAVRQDLPDAVEEAAPFLRLHRPIAVVVTRTDRLPSTPLVEGVRRLSATTGSYPSRRRVMVVGIDAAPMVPAQDERDRQAARLLTAGTHRVVRRLRGLGASVVRWDPTTTSLVRALSSQARLPA